MEEVIERPFKRQRYSDSDIPEAGLLFRRQKNDQKLKTRFESIFDKYGKDFDGVGDEIDLQTGNIIVNNGHLFGMANEKDAVGFGDSPAEQDVGKVSEESDDSDEWSEQDGVLASSLLSQFQQKIRAMHGSGNKVEKDERKASPGSDDADSLMGDAEPDTSDSSSFTEDKLHSYHSSKVEGFMSGDIERSNEHQHARDAPSAGVYWSWSPRKRADLDKEPAESAWSSPFIPKTKPANRVGFKGKNRGLNLNGQFNAISASHDLLRSAIVAHGQSQQPQDDPSSRGSIASEDDFDMPPKSKKPRWTKAEENELRNLMLGTTLGWQEIAKKFPGRPKDAVLLHWSRMLRKDKHLREAGSSNMPLTKDRLPQTKDISARDTGSKGPKMVEAPSGLSNTSQVPQKGLHSSCPPSRNFSLPKSSKEVNRERFAQPVRQLSDTSNNTKGKANSVQARSLERHGTPSSAEMSLYQDESTPNPLELELLQGASMGDLDNSQRSKAIQHENHSMSSIPHRFATNDSSRRNRDVGHKPKDQPVPSITFQRPDQSQRIKPRMMPGSDGSDDELSIDVRSEEPSKRLR